MIAPVHVRELEVRLPVADGRYVHAAGGIDLDVPAGTITAVVGESGSGKSVLGLALLGLLPAGARVRGRVVVDGHPITDLDDRALTGIRGRVIGHIPASARTHLLPTATVGALYRRVLRVHGRPATRGDIIDLLAGVDLAPSVADAYPHELSGGMAARAACALTLALRPNVVVADEPTGALDDESAATVLAALRDRADAGATVLLITHDLLQARAVADRVAVLYAGRFVETGPTSAVWDDPAHDYTRALLDALPERGLVPPPGAPTSLIDLDPDRCAWHDRVGQPCPGDPRLSPIGPERQVACRPC